MDWPAARERLQSLPFAPLSASLATLDANRWPTHEDLTALASQVITSRGMPVRFVRARGNGDPERRYYEERIAATGEIETREQNWHDLFNALAWISFPLAKAAINAQHAAILEERGEAETRRRSPERDALTLFDEGGVLVASTDPSLQRLIVDFRWKELFWERRAELEANVRFIPFGHSLFEKMLDPHLGIVAKTIFVPLAEGFDADALLAAHFALRSNFSSPKAMAPMPVLGIPGWHPSTADESFYDDATHFRKSRPRDGPPRKMHG